MNRPACAPYWCAATHLRLMYRTMYQNIVEINKSYFLYKLYFLDLKPEPRTFLVTLCPIL